MSQQTDLADLIMIGIMLMIPVIYPPALCHEKAEDKQCAWYSSHLDFQSCILRTSFGGMVLSSMPIANG
ncbi:MAG: hypothetical protein B6D72_03840 [gamma proteobacterium symbiont of Ctena orbiculata]|uniref:Uncharacterized protein n=1 Tax=Candidatus Thiodiazotropha taylori TaxID=2792791 RepID=A0A944QRT7_9GAMM|nr:hypothetical protein [Candidatus Thiodiazotropha taylori]PUB88298.1 MAG: hypothetical protein DBP00_06155 [gamma proteobacterium symbiont of Ctena orbiculata]MBT2988128.1 hypothetical protein [Candidatus Thiodiazotropha taylori]MBT2998492.1 hypothetical protein [Candidatus Thiodiazotropha taylori]MBT3002130.1 hypothetical protein [Candidatus Thiodiazotropha taylori]